MPKKLTKPELEKKRDHHESRAKYYQTKIDNLETKSQRVGFRYKGME